MPCQECIERRQKFREALFAGKLAEAAGHAVKGVRQLVVGVAAPENANELMWAPVDMTKSSGFKVKGIIEEPTNDRVDGDRSSGLGETVKGKAKGRHARLSAGPGERDGDGE